MANGGTRCEFETDVLSLFSDTMELEPLLQWLTFLLHRSVQQDCLLVVCRMQTVCYCLFIHPQMRMCIQNIE